MSVLRCKKCGDLIKSMSRHNLVMCKCGSCGIDGGNDYTRIIGAVENWELVDKSERKSELRDELHKLGALKQSLKRHTRQLSKLKRYLYDTSVEEMPPIPAVPPVENITSREEYMKYLNMEIKATMTKLDMTRKLMKITRREYDRI